MRQADDAHLAHPKYRPDIDGLRALAVLSVVGYHAFPSVVTGGFVGVDVFFVISGVLITAIILGGLDRRTFSLLDFYQRRIRRIFPALCVVLLSCLAAGWFVLLADEYSQLGKHVAGGAAFLSNFVLWGESGYFEAGAENKPLLHLWSLGIEEQYYIVWPLLLMGAWRFRLNILTITVALALASFGYNLVKAAHDPLADFYWPQARFWELLAGSLLACVGWQRRRLDALLAAAIFTDRWPAGAVLRNVQSFVGASLIALAIVSLNKTDTFPGYWAVAPVLGAVLIIDAGPGAWLNRTLLAAKPMVWIGLISYPLYLWHWPLISLAHILHSEAPSTAIRGGAVLVSFMLAFATYALVERPLRFGAHRRRKAALLASLMLAAGAAGYATYSTDGVPARSFATAMSKLAEARSDWDYSPTTLVAGKIENIHIFAGQTDRRVLFVGDSLMGQYAPRAIALYFESPRKPLLTTVFAARIHCYPMPDNDYITRPENVSCVSYYPAALELAREPRVERVVFAGNWPELGSGDELTPQAAAFANDLANLRTLGKEVIIVARSPIDRRLDPVSIARAARTDRSLLIGDEALARDQLEDIESLRSLRQISQRSGAALINPLDYLCSASRCTYLRNGDPVFKDYAHIRASFAASSAFFIDPIVNGQAVGSVASDERVGAVANTEVVGGASAGVTVRSSETSHPNPASKLFDAKNEGWPDAWMTEALPRKDPTAWVELSYAQPTSCTQYEIIAANHLPVRFPRGWTVTGTSQGKPPRRLSTVEGQVFGKAEKKVFPCDGRGEAFTTLRFDFRGLETDQDRIAIGELLIR